MTGKNFLLFLAFLEGASVMACELLSAKMIAPFFGGSLYVWTSVLGISLFALMCGYFAGGYFSVKCSSNKFLVFRLLNISGIFLVLMPLISFWILSTFIDLSIVSGVILSLLMFVFPPMFLMASTTPLIIFLYNGEIKTSGESTGLIFFLSTMGGITGTLLCGFYLIPLFGLKIPALIFGLSLILTTSIWLIKNKQIILPIIGFGICVNLIFLGNKKTNNSAQYKIQYAESGVLGQIKVIDTWFNTYSRGTRQGRLLVINNSVQTIADLSSLNYSLWDWSYYFPAAVSHYPKGSKVLLLGLGGGTFLHQFNRLGFDVEVVELDLRIKEAAQRYFNVAPETPISIDDARHYLNICKKKYDIITFDLFYNETPPSHVMSLESFQTANHLLNKGGILMINFYGYLTAEKGRAARSLIKTLTQANYQVNVLPTPGAESHRNLIILASPDKMDFTNVYYEEPGMPPLKNISEKFIDLKTIDFSDAVVLTDSIPVLDNIYLEATLEWRKITNQYYTKNFISSGLRFW